MPEKPANHQEIAVPEPVHIVLETLDNKTPDPWYLKSTFFEFVKWFLGTFVLGSFAIGINCNVQSRETERQKLKDSTDLKVNKIDADAKVIEAISGKFVTDPAIQVKYLVYIRPYVQTRELAHAMDSVIKQLYIAQNPGSSAAKLDNKSNEGKLSPEQKKIYNTTIQSSPDKPQTQIIADEQKVAALPPVKTTDTIIKQIEKAHTLSAPVTSDNYTLSSLPQTLWCKQGYYVQFNNTLQIGINELNEAGISARITDLTAGADNVIEPQLSIQSGAQKVIFSKDGKLKYLVSLDYIGNAGVNPFKKAAYITVTTYKKP